MFQYPSSDLDRGRKLLALLGSFWATVYDGRDVVRLLGEARGEAEQQNWLRLMEAVRAFSRYEVPIFSRRNWTLHVIRRSEGTPVLTWTLPERMAHAPVVMNRIADPSVVLTHGPDFVVAGDTIVFRLDPFQDPKWGTRPVMDGDAQTDTELFLWIFRGEFDFKTVYEHWGYVLGLALDSSAAYRDLLNAVFDALAGGTALEQVQLAYAAMTGLPLARGGETVEAILHGPTRVSVVTDRTVYDLPPDAVLTVAAGDALRPGQGLCDGLLFAELGTGAVPDWVDALVLGRGMLVGRFHSDLVFENADHPLAVTTDEDGYTRVEFPVGGFPLDVEEFWDKVHYQGRARGATLAQLLDTRTNKEGGEPGPSNLPATVNPVAFLVSQVLRHNAVLVRVRMAALPAGAIGLHPARLLRKIVPPGTCVLVLIEVSPRTSSVILNEPATADLPGGRHALGAFSGAPTVAQVIGEGSLSTRVSAWKVSGTCQ